MEIPSLLPEQKSGLVVQSKQPQDCCPRCVCRIDRKHERAGRKPSPSCSTKMKSSFWVSPKELRDFCQPCKALNRTMGSISLMRIPGGKSASSPHAGCCTNSHDLLRIPCLSQLPASAAPGFREAAQLCLLPPQNPPAKPLMAIPLACGNSSPFSGFSEG